MLYIDTVIEEFSSRRCMLVCSDRTVTSPSEYAEVNENRAEFFKFLEDNMTKIEEVGITGDSVQTIEELDVFCMLINLFSMKVHLYLTDTNNMQMIDKLTSNQYIQAYTIIGK